MHPRYKSARRHITHDAQYPTTAIPIHKIAERGHWCVTFHKTYNANRGLTHHPNKSAQCRIFPTKTTKHLPILRPNNDCNKLLKTQLSLQRHLFYRRHKQNTLKELSNISNTNTHQNRMINKGVSKHTPGQKHDGVHYDSQTQLWKCAICNKNRTPSRLYKHGKTCMAEQ